MLKIDHVAVASNTEAESDEFFVNLLGLKKARMFTVPSELSEKFFGVKKEIPVIRYQDENTDIEVLITMDDSKTKDIYTHSCIKVKNPEEFVKKAVSMGFRLIKVPRKDNDGFYLFINDAYGNLYEIK